jgi:hypothetical protein
MVADMREASALVSTTLLQVESEAVMDEPASDVHLLAKRFPSKPHQPRHRKRTAGATIQIPRHLADHQELRRHPQPESELDRHRLRPGSGTLGCTNIAVPIKGLFRTASTKVATPSGAPELLPKGKELHIVGK